MMGTPRRLDLVAVAGVSAALLALEVLLLRLFEFSHWYHFAGLAISLALLGLGAAGTTLALVGRYRFSRGDGWFLAGLAITGGGFLLLLLVQSRVALRPVFAGWNMRELVRLLLVDFVAFIPFYGAGLAIGQVFLRWPENTRALYAANLLGSGAGSLGAAALLAIAPVAMALAVVAALLFALGSMLGFARNRWPTGVICCLGLVLALVASVRPPEPAVSDFKALSEIRDLPGVETLAVRSGLPGRLSLFRADSLRFAPGLSLGWTSSVPSVDAAVIGSDRVVPMPRQWPANAEYMRGSLAGLPLQLRPEGRVLVLGSGAWQTLIAAQGRDVAWVEPDARLLGIAQARGASKAGVRLIEDGTWRHLVIAADAPYSIIAFDAAWEEGDAAAEDYTLTVAGLELALTRLNTNGLLAIPLPLDYPPRYYPRVMATLDRALRQHGAAEPGDRVAVLRGLQALLILASPQPLDEADLAELREFSERWRFDTAWLPGIGRGQTNRYHRLDTPVFHDIARALFERQPLPREASLFHAAPAELDSPYPWRSLAWGKASRIVRELGGQGWSYLDWTLILLVVTTVVVAMLAFLLILVPLGRLPQIQRPFSRLSVAGYFIALGMGYILVELVIFQRLILYLGEPVLVAALVFATFLIGSGIGSAMTPETASHGSLIRVYTAVALGLALALVPFLAVHALSTPAFPLRIALLVMLLLPLAWAMGRPFPWALRQLAGQDRWIPWAWGINGFASVLGAALAPLLSVHFGQSSTLAAGGICYVLAFAIGSVWLSRMNPKHA
ncbi:hypothetical protein L861_22675 [Litchfieldella anticariensis FP35 = DSM 16096]|uniref:Spermidine synthase n=1 Tax=Litchfieldella anticariensis (strain DSM 16096 / CECT 5854 / CIP 108499 / LMG 22089 / FP35) TaxID=1121939 RepID=S2KRJ6_LITA3|nr:hypothetical protein [Halomonas anticariensis]EPC03118.1 hypothetical protein L861_22675 [Halomonas anticariensis FP35 = DSM 16096]